MFLLLVSFILIHYHPQLVNVFCNCFSHLLENPFENRFGQKDRHSDKQRDRPTDSRDDWLACLFFLLRSAGYLHSGEERVDDSEQCGLLHARQMCVYSCLNLATLDSIFSRLGEGSGNFRPEMRIPDQKLYLNPRRNVWSFKIWL